MRKRSSSSLFFIFVLIIALILSACSQSQETQKQTDAPAQSSGEQTTVHEHSFGEWVVKKEATYYEEGHQERSCTCGETETESIPRKEISTKEDAYKVLLAGPWHSVLTHKDADKSANYYLFTDQTTGYICFPATDRKIEYAWDYKDGFVTISTSKQSVIFQLIQEEGVFALSINGGSNFFVQRGNYEKAYAIYHEKIKADSFDIETDNVKIDLDRSIVLYDGDIKVEIIALVQESMNISGKGVRITKRLLFKTTNKCKQEAGFSVKDVYIGNESANGIEISGTVHLKPGKTGEAQFLFQYDNYNEDELASLYDLTKLNGSLQVYYYPDSHSFSYGPIFDFDLSKYSNEIKTAIDNYVKTH